MERFHTIRIDRNGVMELIRVPHPANGDDAANEPILPYGLVKVELPVDDVMQPEVGRSDMVSRSNTDKGERNPSSQKDGSTPPLLPVVKVEHQKERVLPEILGTIVEVEVANSTNGRDERSTVDTGDSSPRQVAVSELDTVPSLGGQTTMESTFSATSTHRDQSAERPILLVDMRRVETPVKDASFDNLNINARANNATEVEAMASLYPSQSSMGGKAVCSQHVTPSIPTRQCSPHDQVADSRNAATMPSLVSESTTSTSTIPVGERILPQINNASTGLSVLLHDDQINVQVGGKGHGSTMIPNDGCLSQQLLLTGIPDRKGHKRAKNTSTGTNGRVPIRKSLRIIRLKAISKSSNVTLNVVSGSRRTSAVRQADKFVLPVSGSLASTPALAIAHPDSHTPAKAGVPSRRGQSLTRMEYAYDPIHVAAKLASMTVMGSRLGRPRNATKIHQLSGSVRRPLLPAPHKQSHTSTPKAVPSAYLVYPNGKVTPLFEVPSNKLNVATNPPLGIRPLSSSPNVGGKRIPQKRTQLSASPIDQVQPVLLRRVFPNPLTLIQAPLSPDLPEANGTVSSSTSPAKRKQRKPSAALPMRSAAKTGPIKKTSAYNPGYARRVRSRSIRIEEIERIGSDHARHVVKNAATRFRHTEKSAKSSTRKPKLTVSVPLKSNLHSVPIINGAEVDCSIPHRKTAIRLPTADSTVHSILPLDESTSTTEITRPIPSNTCTPLYECHRSRAKHNAPTLTTALDDNYSRHLPRQNEWCTHTNGGHTAFVPVAAPYPPLMPRVFCRPVTQFDDKCAFSDPRNWGNLTPDETIYPRYNDLEEFYIPGGPGCKWGFRPVAGAAPLFPRVRRQTATTAPPRRKPPGERNNSQEHHDNSVVYRPQSSCSDAPVNDDPTLHVSGIDYGSIKRRRDTNEGQYGLSKPRRRNVLCTRTVAARSGESRRGLPVRKHPFGLQSRHIDIRPCSVLITRLDMEWKHSC